MNKNKSEYMICHSEPKAKILVYIHHNNTHKITHFIHDDIYLQLLYKKFLDDVKSFFDKKSDFFDDF